MALRKAKTLPLFDQMDERAGKVRKKAGMAQAESHRKKLLSEVRAGLRALAATREDRTVDADDATDWLIEHQYGPHALGPASGSLFRGPEWMFTGQWVNSRKISNHAASIRRWRLK